MLICPDLPRIDEAACFIDHSQALSADYGETENIVRICDSPGSAITARKSVMADTRSRRKNDNGNRAPGQDRTGLDMGVEGADQHATRFETLTIEGNAVRERRIAQRSEPV